MKGKILIILIALELGFSNLYGQNLSLHVDSLVISSLPWQLSPGMFGRSDEEIRGNHVIVVKDSTAISEFIHCTEVGFNNNVDQGLFIDPRIVIDVYCGKTFFSVSVSEDRLCWYSNKNVVTVNVCLFKWVTNYVPMMPG